MSSNPKRATVYFDPELHRALRVKAAETDRSMSDLVNEAVQLSLVEDADDLAAFEDRVNEPSLPYEDVVKDLKRRGKIYVSIKRSAVKEIEAIPQKKERQRIIRRIGQLAEDPRPPGSKKLSGNDKYRVRKGSFCIVYSIEDNELIVVVVKVGHRKDVYRGTL